MEEYLKVLKDVRKNGVIKSTDRERTRVSTRSQLGAMMRFDLEGRVLPVVTTKKIHLRSVIYELLWFLRGDSNIKFLNDNGVTIWDEWADDNGELGPIYGVQWRSWPLPNGESLDQLTKVMQQVQAKPFSRQNVVSAWNAGQIDDMALPPCPTLFQFHGRPGNRLSLQLYQRSADMFLGVPFNITSYSLLLSMVAHVLGMIPHEVIHMLGDYHIYLNHMDQVDTQLKRKPRPLPTLVLPEELRGQGPEALYVIKYDDIKIKRYKPHPSIAGKVAV